VQTYVGLSAVFKVLGQRGISWEAWAPNFIPLVIGIAAQLAIVRLLLEVAATILLVRRDT
jgi:hypothetical protein